jgi:hypothetical protein
MAYAPARPAASRLRNTLSYSAGDGIWGRCLPALLPRKPGCHHARALRNREAFFSGRSESRAVPFTETPVVSNTARLRAGADCKRLPSRLRVQRWLLPLPSCTRADRAERQAHMGEAIARFREMALAVRRTCDEAMVHPGHLFLLSAGNPLQAAAIVEQLKAGRLTATKFADLLRKSGGLPGVPDISGLGLFDVARRKILARGPQQPEFDRAYSLAVREAARHADLFDVLERRLHCLRLSTIGLSELAGDSSSSRHITHKRKYAAQLDRWHEAYEALSAFIEEPPASQSDPEKKTVSKQPKHRKRPGSGGRPAKFPIKFIREVVTARERYQKHAAKARRPLLPFPQWLSEYFTNVKNLPLSTLPHKDPKKPEEWSIRANRFWKSAKTRLSRAGD